MNKIELKPIRELLGMNFFIPPYQRGYRWTKQQVKDLLDDIQEFREKKQGSFYCIQPLVVRKSICDLRKFKEKLNECIEKEKFEIDDVGNIISNSTKWEVIDGQQRLTTIHILLSYLEYNKEDMYKIEYKTRLGSQSFLSDINENEIQKKDDNIDYYHIVEAFNQIKDWFEEEDRKTDDLKKDFLDTLLNKIQFIWYESVNEDPINVFTRLNTGKISLTNAELIKALFLNKSNFEGSDYQKIKLWQQEIAGEWDHIEYTLQNDEFWLFLNNPEDNKTTLTPTRIDFIFSLMGEKNVLKLQDKYITQLGKDEYKTFRYFYFYFKQIKEEKNEYSKKIKECWKEIKTIYHTFQEWFNDLELYHYIGYLLSEVNKQPISEIRISDLIEEWNRNTDKKKFVEAYLNDKIRETISNCRQLDKQYEITGNPKTQCRPILLLHNIQTIIKQNKTLKNNDKYKLPVFHKFPFHLFKKEKWDVEHIDSHTENDLSDVNDQKDWLKKSYLGVSNALKEKINKFVVESKEGEVKPSFDELYKEIADVSNTDKLEDGKQDANGNVINEKDKLWNFCLLDSSTNRSYKNDIFPAKRCVIIGKSQGKRIEINKDFSVEEEEGEIAFIPICTEKIFQKAFNPLPSNLREWDKNDAEEYLKNIETILSDFLKEKEDNNE